MVPRCPDNEEWAMEKKVSRFAFVSGGKEEGGESEEVPPGMEEVMANLEREMAGMDESNPDPRQMAHLMRKMGDLTGMPMEGPMEEMLNRMEKGENPELLEEEYGSLIDEQMGEEDNFDFQGMVKKSLRARPPVKDERVFEMEEWV